MQSSLSKFALRVKQHNNNQYTLLSNDIHFLLDYNKIIEEIIERFEKSNTSKQNCILFLTHYPTSLEIKVNNKEEWDFLYNYDIINECINKNYKMKISYKIEKDITQIKRNSNEFKEIIKYILSNKIPKSYYLKLLYKFMNKDDISEKFQLFLLNELKPLGSKEIMSEKNNYDILKTSKSKINDEQYFTEENKNNYLIKTEEFQKIFNISEIMKSIKKVKDIINKESEQKINIDDIKEKETNKIEKEESKNILLDLMNKEIEILKSDYLDEKKNLIKFNPETYYSGIETLKENLEREFLLIQ